MRILVPRKTDLISALLKQNIWRRALGMKRSMVQLEDTARIIGRQVKSCGKPKTPHGLT